MALKEIAFKIEDLVVEAEKIESMQKALWQAIWRGDLAECEYEWAFVVFGDLTFALKNNLQTLSDEVFKTLKGEG